MKNKVKLSNAQKTQVKQICKVLVPEFSKVVVKTNGKVSFCRPNSTHTSSPIIKTRGLDLNYVLNYVLPLRLTLFKYNNSQFLPEVQKDLVSIKMDDKDVLDYYYSEILALKFPDLSNTVKLRAMVNPTLIKFEEAEDFNYLDYVTIVRVPMYRRTGEIRKFIDEWSIEITVLLSLIVLGVGFYLFTL